MCLRNCKAERSEKWSYLHPQASNSQVGYDISDIDHQFNQVWPYMGTAFVPIAFSLKQISSKTYFYLFLLCHFSSLFLWRKKKRKVKQIKLALFWLAKAHFVLFSGWMFRRSIDGCYAPAVIQHLCLKGTHPWTDWPGQRAWRASDLSLWTHSVGAETTQWGEEAMLIMLTA